MIITIKTTLRSHKNRVSNISPNFLNLHFFKNNAANIIPVLLAQVTYRFFSGTFQEETKEEVVYGLVHPLRSWDIIYTQVSHFLWMWKCFWQREGWKNKLNTVFMGPGWAPGKPRFGCHDDIPEVRICKNVPHFNPFGHILFICWITIPPPWFLKGYLSN
jgi:hypothetical protein